MTDKIRIGISKAGKPILRFAPKHPSTFMESLGMSLDDGFISENYYNYCKKLYLAWQETHDSA